MTAHIGPRREAVLQAWGELVATEAAGEAFDFTASNRTVRTQELVDAFVATPTRERLAALWTEDVLGDAVVGGVDGVVAAHGESLDAVAETFAEMRAADAYDEAWESRFVVPEVAWEAYGRLHPESAPVLNSTGRTGLARMGFERPRTYDEAVAAWRAFRDVYESVVGHATAGTPHESSLNHEIGEFLWFVVRTDNLQAVLGSADDAYRPLVGWEEEAELERDFELSGHERHLDGFVDAYRNGGFEEHGDEDRWNNGYWEDWKGAYLDHVDANVRPKYDLTALDPGDVEPLLDDLTVRTTISATVPTYLLGGRSGGILWNSFRDHATANPDAAAGTLSYLFDEAVDVTLRLDRFEETFGAVEEGGGGLLSLATMLLTFVHPRQYVFYKYGLLSEFFDRYANFDVPTGFNPVAYWKLNEACKLQLLKPLTERLPGESITMLDVYTLLYVWNGNYND